MPANTVQSTFTEVNWQPADFATLNCGASWTTFEATKSAIGPCSPKSSDAVALARAAAITSAGSGVMSSGFVTGLCGRPSIAATTVAVERVVLRHLDMQLRELRDADPDAYRVINSILADEREHHDRAALEKRQGVFWPRVLKPIVSVGTEAVIWLGMHL